MAIGFYLAYPNREKSHIKLIVQHKGCRYTRSVGETVLSSKWDQAKQRVKVSADYRVGVELNFKIQQLRSAIERLISQNPAINNSTHFWRMVDCEVSGQPYNVIKLNPKSFNDYFENIYIPRYKLEKSLLRIRRFKATLEILRKFDLSVNRNHTFDQIGSHYYREFQAYFRKEGYSVNYFGTTIKQIKQVMREALMVDKLHDNQEFLGANFKATSAEADTVYLTMDELSAIEALVIDDVFINEIYPESEHSGLASRVRSYNLARDLFLIGAYTGLRLSDFKRLKPEHFADGKISIITEKTGAKVVIPISGAVQRILDRGFNFKSQISEQKLRVYVKQICRMAGITQLIEVRDNSMSGTTVDIKPKYELVGTHTARRSFATNAYKAGIPPIAIMKITGHTKESTFMKYIRVSQEENADILAQHPFFK